MEQADSFMPGVITVPPYSLVSSISMRLGTTAAAWQQLITIVNGQKVRLLRVKQKDAVRKGGDHQGANPSFQKLDTIKTKDVKQPQDETSEYPGCTGNPPLRLRNPTLFLISFHQVLTQVCTEATSSLLPSFWNQHHRMVTGKAQPLWRIIENSDTAPPPPSWALVTWAMIRVSFLVCP